METDDLIDARRIEARATNNKAKQIHSKPIIILYVLLN
jgi:hypothetical protein